MSVPNSVEKLVLEIVATGGRLTDAPQPFGRDVGRYLQEVPGGQTNVPYLLAHALKLLADRAPIQSEGDSK